jgi:hypothetical protein
MAVYRSLLHSRARNVAGPNFGSTPFSQAPQSSDASVLFEASRLFSYFLFFILFFSLFFSLFFLFSFISLFSLFLFVREFAIP